MINYPHIEIKTQLTSDEFIENYVSKKPVLLKNFVSQWNAIDLWNKEYFLEKAGTKKIYVDLLNDQGRKIQRIKLPLVDYIKSVIEKKRKSSPLFDASYFYDLPLPTLISDLKEDMAPFPLLYMESWYRPNWWKNIFLFFTYPETIIPFHFDNLGTHNLYFHLKGSKKMFLTLAEDIHNCYMMGNHSQVNPQYPDFKNFPLFKNASTFQVILSPGDCLYLPPFTLHQVHSMNQCISVKIDWHTKKSALFSLTNLYRGIKLSTIYYNLIYTLGIVFRIPSKVLYIFYKKSLSRFRILKH